MSVHQRLLAAVAVALLTATSACSNDEQVPAEEVDITTAPQDLTWRNVSGLEVPTSR